jgi:hypothetical protein
MGVDAVESGFRARAGTLTLLYIAGSAGRDDLRAILVEAATGAPVGDSEARTERLRRQSEELDRMEFDAEVEQLDDDDDDDDDDPAGAPTVGFDGGNVLDEDYIESAVPDEGFVPGPHTPMRLTPPGEEMLYVAFSLTHWLRNSPDHPRELGEEAIVPLTGLVLGWASGVTHALARRSLSIDELKQAVPLLSREEIEERVATMEAAEQLEAVSGGSGGTRYRVTDHLREGIAPLAAAARLERHQRHEDCAPPNMLDVEAAFLLALPLVQLPIELSGRIRLAVQITGGPPLTAGVMATVEEGRVVSCDTRLDPEAETWASGEPIEWMDTLVDPAVAKVESGGDRQLAGALLTALHEKLFGTPPLP